MSQHIGIQICNEKFEVIKKTTLNFAVIRNITENFPEDMESILINQIDPYGITLYNYSQTKRLNLALQKFIDKNKLNNEAVGVAHEILNEINEIENYQFIKFIGD